MITLEVRIARQRPVVRIFSLIGRGLRCITSASGSSSPSAIAGGPSMMMFTHRMAMAANGFPLAMSRSDDARKRRANPMVVLS